MSQCDDISANQISRMDRNTAPSLQDFIDWPGVGLVDDFNLLDHLVNSTTKTVITVSILAYWLQIHICTQFAYPTTDFCLYTKFWKLKG